MNLSMNMAEKSVQAAVAAIESDNKPDFLFREEAFGLLMMNAWEFLLKAKSVMVYILTNGQGRIQRCDKA